MFVIFFSIFEAAVIKAAASVIRMQSQCLAAPLQHGVLVFWKAALAAHSTESENLLISRLLAQPSGIT